MPDTPKKYTVALKRYTGLRAVWPPTSKWKLGDYVVRDRGFFHRIGNITTDFGIDAESSEGPPLEIHFQTSKVYITKIEAGAKVDEFTDNLGAEAKLKLKFKGNYSFFMHSKPAVSAAIDAKSQLGSQIADKIEKWRHKDWFVISEVYRVDSFVLLANETREKDIEIKGNVGTVTTFLRGSVAPEVRISSLAGMGLKIVGNQSGPIAIELFRVKKDGDIDFV
ncbi:MAG: hypothetical protein GTO17_04380 [Candidatus Aminicenantes bacterium]|nr:hypothetical protein [Candidatus Aminicenantes bacterium]